MEAITAKLVERDGDWQNVYKVCFYSHFFSQFRRIAVSYPHPGSYSTRTLSSCWIEGRRWSLQVLVQSNYFSLKSYLMNLINCPTHREQFYIIDVLEKFQCIDEKHIDQGLHVRRLAKQINYLMRNKEKLRSERRKHALHLDPGEDERDEEELMEQAVAESLRTAASLSTSAPISSTISSSATGSADMKTRIGEGELAWEYPALPAHDLLLH